MSSLFINPQGNYQLAGNALGSSGQGSELFGSTLTPGYTGGANSQTLYPEGVSPDLQALFGFLGQRDERERQRAIEDWERARQMRKEEAQEAFQMKTIAAIPGQITDMFKTYAQLSYPAAAIEIQSRTAPLLANVYGSNPYAGRKWLG